MKDEAQGASAAGRAALIGAALALTFLIGHYGLGPVVEGLAPRPRGETETRVAAARDIPVPPRGALYASGDSAGDPHRVLLRYVSQAGVEEIADYYRREMPARGWTPIDVEAARAEFPDGAILGYSALAGSWCMITISKMAQGGVGVTILKMRGVAPTPRAPQRAPKEEST
jgi:hypothetical protein